MWRRLVLHVRIAVVMSLAMGPAMWLVSGHAMAESGDPLVRAEAIARLSAPEPMVTIPAGWFLMGSPRLNATFGLSTPYDNTEIPQRRIWLDEYAIDRDEVSVGNYFRWLLHVQPDRRPNVPEWLAAAGAVPDRRLATLPAFDVTWFEAAEYCRSHGKRLPTEAEWEKAARGVDGRLFPWGEAAPDATRAVFGRSEEGPVPSVAPVDSMEEGSSPHGLHHMAGNVAEWVQDWSGIDFYVSMPDRNPQGAKQGRYKVVRGGSWRSPPVMLRAATRGGALPERRASTIGFRCARSTSMSPTESP
ncbi:MAG: SUMF1/EgtB/PvdO family nonheme iron enzyme [Nitrospirae bacterium]|nr:SUMF1/EgtB/PvdO family nonheme iron enzyme [Nitrospirota bacterium]